MRVFVDLGREPVPDETTMCCFRHLLEQQYLGRRLFEEVQRHLAEKGLKLAPGTIVDATIISAPSSTKNAEKARDPACQCRLQHGAPDLLHGRETRVWGDQAYRGQRAVIRHQAPRARHFTNRRYRHRGLINANEQAKNHTKSKVRGQRRAFDRSHQAVFGFAKVRYRGPKKNAHRLIVTSRWPICS
jgi:IS5 family transposase